MNPPVDYWWRAVHVAQSTDRWGALHPGELRALRRYLEAGGDESAARERLIRGEFR